MTYGKRSKKKLLTTSSGIQKVFNKAIKDTPYDFGIARGYSSPGEQFKLYLKGREERDGHIITVDKKKVVTYLDGFIKKSRHNSNPSQAVDIYGWHNGRMDYDDDRLTDIARHILGIAKKMFKAGDIPHMIEWGYDLWKWDKPHFQEKIK